MTEVLVLAVFILCVAVVVARVVRQQNAPIGGLGGASPPNTDPPEEADRR